LSDEHLLATSRFGDSYLKGIRDPEAVVALSGRDPAPMQSHPTPLRDFGLIADY
jgi:hypothetical protein